MGRLDMPDARTDKRAEQLKAALRENLKRRKTQARGREASASADDEGNASAPKRDAR